MCNSVESTARTAQDNTDVFPRPKAAKVTTARHAAEFGTTEDNAGGDPLSELVLGAARAAHGGKQEAAAAHVGKDPGNFSRDMKRISESLGKLGPLFLSRLGEDLVRQYGPLTDPKDYYRELIRGLRKHVDELEQFGEHIS